LPQYSFIMAPAAEGAANSSESAARTVVVMGRVATVLRNAGDTTGIMSRALLRRAIILCGAVREKEQTKVAECGGKFLSVLESGCGCN